MTSRIIFLLCYAFCFVLYSCIQKSEKVDELENGKFIYLNYLCEKGNSTEGIKVLKSEGLALIAHMEKYPYRRGHLNAPNNRVSIWGIDKQTNHVKYLTIEIARNLRVPEQVDLSVLHSLKYVEKLEIAAPTVHAKDLAALAHLDTLRLAYAKIKRLVFPKNLRHLQYLDTGFCEIDEVNLNKDVAWELGYLECFKIRRFESDTLKKLQYLGLGKVDTLNMGLFPNIETCRTICRHLRTDTLKQLRWLSVGEIQKVNLGLFPNLEKFEATATYLDTTYLKQQYPHIEMFFSNLN